MMVLCGCAPGIGPPPPEKPGPAVPVVPNDSIIVAQILSIKPLADVFPWQVELRLTDSQDVPGYVNMTRVKVGQTLLTKTQENMAAYGKGDTITGHLSLKGDERGTFFYLSNISES